MKYKDPIFYKIIRPLAKGLFIFLYRPTVIGKENIPKEGGIVIASNHKHNFDCAMMLISTKRCIHFLAKDELFHGIFGWFFKAMGLIPVKRKTKDGKALPTAVSYLENGKVIGIFPEGTFNRSGNVILPFKIGAVKMAHDTNCKIIPCVIKGEYKMFHKGPTIEFFKPIKSKSDNLDEDNQVLMDFISKKLSK